MENNLDIGISEGTAEWLLGKQRRCVECGSVNREIHHRIYRSQWSQEYINNFFGMAFVVYEQCYKKVLIIWGLHSVQNLVCLCNKCHTRLHSGNAPMLAKKYRLSFTCPRTGYNVFYKKRVCHY